MADDLTGLSLFVLIEDEFGIAFWLAFAVGAGVAVHFGTEYEQYHIGSFFQVRAVLQINARRAPGPSPFRRFAIKLRTNGNGDFEFHSHSREVRDLFAQIAADILGIALELDLLSVIDNNGTKGALYVHIDDLGVYSLTRPAISLYEVNGGIYEPFDSFCQIPVIVIGKFCFTDLGEVYAGLGGNEALGAIHRAHFIRDKAYPYSFERPIPGELQSDGGFAMRVTGAYNDELIGDASEALIKIGYAGLEHGFGYLFVDTHCKRDERRA